MPIVALVGFGVFLALAFGLRSIAHYRRTGATGFVGISGAPGSAEWIGGMLFVVALGAGALAPIAQLLGWVSMWTPLARPAWFALAIGLYALGVGATLWAQFAMGDAWRIGVDTAQRTDLVAAGPFRWVRNPIFTSMLVATLGLALLVPNLFSAIAMLALIVALELQVRLVEEPYLLGQHGERYREYAARTGRFVPGVGYLRSGLGRPFNG